MDKRDILMEQINKLISGPLTFNDFTKNFWSYFVTEVRSKDLTENDYDFFAEIQETFDWTVENPSDEERGYGYLDWQQFIEFVKQVTEFYRKNSKLDNKDASKIKSAILKKGLV